MRLVCTDSDGESRRSTARSFAKQKARRIYGVLERQFRKTYAEAERLTGATGGICCG